MRDKTFSLGLTANISGDCLDGTNSENIKTRNKPHRSIVALELLLACGVDAIGPFEHVGSIPSRLGVHVEIKTSRWVGSYNGMTPRHQQGRKENDNKTSYKESEQNTESTIASSRSSEKETNFLLLY